MPLKLKTVMASLEIGLRALADQAGISPSTLSNIINHGAWPKRTAADSLRASIVEALRSHGATESDLDGVFGNPDSKRRKPRAKEQQFQKEDPPMLLRRQGLFPATKQHFALSRDPFTNDVSCHDDVFLSGDVRYVREAMLHTSKHGGFLAVVGESGSGKSTLRRDLIDRLTREDEHVITIEPYVLGMEDTDAKGKMLRALHIAEAIMAAVAPTEKIYNSPEARFRQLHTKLRDSCRAGRKHVLIIKEAHGISLVTLKHLKRFLELEDGFQRLLSIILLGQPELRQKLSESNSEVREVVQRCEVIELRPLNGNLGQYLQHKLARAGADMAKIISEEGVEAIKIRLTGPAARSGGKDSVSYCYPLAVGNMLTAAMNLAAEIGAPLVDQDIIRQV